MIWRIDREAAIFLGAGRALLLQLAHPWIAAAIAEHSKSLDDPIGRFHRTFEIVFTMVFGALDQALAAARRLHRRHQEITGLLSGGSSYRANDMAALAWVHATLVETAMLAHDLVLPPPTAAQCERYWAESRLFAGLFGISDSALPADWTGFRAFCADWAASDRLAVGEPARDIAEALLSGGRTGLRVPLWYRAVTARLLPPRLRQGFGLAYGERERHAAERALARLRRVYPWLPPQLRHVGPYREARARLAGHSPGPLTRLSNRLWIGRPRIG